MPRICDELIATVVCRDCTNSTVSSVMCHRRLWTEHPIQFVTGHRHPWTWLHRRFTDFSRPTGKFGGKNEPIRVPSHQSFPRELGLTRFASVTRHTLWTYGLVQYTYEGAFCIKFKLSPGGSDSANLSFALLLKECFFLAFFFDFEGHGASNVDKKCRVLRDHVHMSWSFTMRVVSLGRSCTTIIQQMASSTWTTHAWSYTNELTGSSWTVCRRKKG